MSIRADGGYRVDEDPVVLRFHHHVRLILLLTQILMAQAVDPTQEIEGPQEDEGRSRRIEAPPARALEALLTLHCCVEEMPLFGARYWTG